MRQYIHASATALAFFKRKALCRLKAESKRLKAGSKPNQQQFTQGLPLRPNAVSDAGLVTMTPWECGAVRINRSAIIDKIIPNSKNPSLTHNSALAVAVEMKNKLHLLCSNWLSGGFFWLLFSAAGKLQSTLEFLKKQLNLEKKILALPLAMRRGDDGSQDYSKKSVNAASSQQQFTQGLSPRSIAMSDAGLVTMTTRECGAVQINRSALINKIIPKSNNPSLTPNSALFYAVVLQKIKHCLYSKKRSGEFFIRCLLFFKGFQVFAVARVWLLFLRKKLRSTLECLTIKLKRNEKTALAILSAIKKQMLDRKKLLAFPPAMRREDYDLQNHFKKRFNSEPRQQQFTRGFSPRSIAVSSAGLVTMTVDGEAVQINRSALINKIIPKSNNPSLTPNSALFYAVVIQKIKHCLYSKKRSGEFFGDFFAEKKLLAIPPAMRREDYDLQNHFKKKLLAFPPAMRRGDDGSQDYSKKSVNAASSQQQFTQGLSPRSNAKSDAGLVTMTPWECGTVLINGIISINNSSPKSNNLSLTKNSALAVAVEMKNKLHLLCSNWRSGGFFWVLFSAAGKLQSTLEFLKKQLKLEKKLLALPPAMRRGDYNSKNSFQNRDNSKPSQKQLTRGLPQPSSHKADASGFAMTGKGEEVLINNRQHYKNHKHQLFRPSIIMTIVLITVVVIGSKRTNAQTKPLQIGDTISQSTFNNLKSSLNKNKETIELANKPLLLIFWNPLCREAKQQLQQFNQLQKQYGEQVQLLGISKDAVTATKADELKIPILSGYSHLDSLFPHQILPHVVWLNEVQQIKAISAGDFVDSLHIKRLLNNQALAIPEKKDQLHFDAKKNWLQFNTGEQLGKSAYYSYIGGQIAGINPQYGVKVDSLKGTIRTYVYNFDAYHLYLLSINRFLGLPANRVIWEVKTPERFRYESSMGYRSLWEQQYQYCYESVWPISISTTERLDRIRQDLNTMLGVNARWENRSITAWVIQADGKPPISRGGKAINSLAMPGAVKILQNEYLKALVYELNKNPKRPPVIDETGWIAKVDFQIPGDTNFDDLNDLNKALKAYHLKLVAAERSIPFFVLSDINPSKP